MKTNELTGAALNWAVAKCEAEREAHSYVNTPNGKLFIKAPLNPAKRLSAYTPPTDWAQGGPIIERERIGTLFDSGSACRRPCWFATPDDQSTSCSYEGEFFDPTFMVTESVGMYGPTPLIAAMRCYVASKLGDEVELPDGL